MKLIEQSATIVQAINPVFLIEEAGRTCYKSEDQVGCATDQDCFIEDGRNVCANCPQHSSTRFIRSLIKRGHTSVLEHGTISLRIFPQFHRFIPDKYMVVDRFLDEIHVTGNFRSWRNWLMEPTKCVGDEVLRQSVLDVLMENYGPAFIDIKWENTEEPLCRVDIIEPEYEPWPNEKRDRHTRMSIRFVTNRGVSHELVRHRVGSFSQESTRYVKYDGEMEFILPVWLEGSEDLTSGVGKLWVDSMANAEESYRFLLDQGWRPEQAREVLPNSLKTEIVVTMSLSEWRAFFDQRFFGRTGRPHPQMEDLAGKAFAESSRLYPGRFDDMV